MNKSIPILPRRLATVAGTADAAPIDGGAAGSVPPTMQPTTPSIGAGQLAEVKLQGECAGPPGQRVLVSPVNVASTMQRLRTAIAAEDLRVVAEIDSQMLLAKAGYAIPACRELSFFHPRYTARLLAANAAAIAETPLKLVVMATEVGAIVRYLEPLSTLGHYKGLEDLAAELSEVMRRVVSDLDWPHRDSGVDNVLHFSPAAQRRRSDTDER